MSGGHADDKDVTAETSTENPDDESCPITKCVCGATYQSWSRILSIYRNDPAPMPCCGRRLYFSNAVRVYEVTE